MELSALLRSRLLRGSAVIALARLATTGTGLGINMLIARLLPLDEVGAYFLLTSIIQVGAIIAMGGVNQSAIPLISSELTDPRRSRVYANLVGLAVYAGFTILFVGILLFGLFDTLVGAAGIDASGLLIAIPTTLWLLFRSGTQLVSHFLRSFGRLALFGLLETLQFNVVFFIACLFLFLRGENAPLSEVLMWAAGAAAVGFPVAILALTRDISPLPREGSANPMQILAVSTPLWVTVAASAVLANVHLWISGALGSEESAALFGAALRVSTLLALPLLAVNMAIAPRVAALWRKGDLAQLQYILRSSATANAGISLVILAGFLVAGPATLGVLFGEAFEAAWPAFVILLIGRTINATTGSPMILLTNSGEQRAAMIITLTSGFVGFGLSLVFGQMDPLRGVAVGAVFTMALQNMGALAYCRISLGLNTLPTLDFRRSMKPRDGDEA